MQHPPFHRRVLLWVFVIMFLAVAPSAIFYTAGYRWNPKKGAIERNGTVIIDTIPEGAKITMNGTVLAKASPVTQQDVAPGTYRIALTLSGYHPWEKVLDVRPERVTFVNDVEFWPITTDPSAIDETSARAIETSPNGRYVAYVRNRNGEMGVSIIDSTNGKRSEYGFSTSTFSGIGQLEWSSDSSAVFVHDDHDVSWIVNRTGTRAISLPDGTYRWSGKDLVGVSAVGKTTYNTTSGAASRTTLAKGVLDTEGVYDIVESVSSTALALRDRSDPNRLFELPPGDWSFSTAPDGMIAVYQSGREVIFNGGTDPTSAAVVASNSQIETLKMNGETSLLTVQANEIWLSTLGSEPELLLRKSVPIRSAVWHRLGKNLFYASPTEVVALNLDSRDGRMETTLAQFDEIFGIAVVKKNLYVSAKKQGTEGVWSVRIE